MEGPKKKKKNAHPLSIPAHWGSVVAYSDYLLCLLHLTHLIAHQVPTALLFFQAVLLKGLLQSDRKKVFLAVLYSTELSPCY